MRGLWEALVRWRTWLVNLVLSGLVLIPIVLNSPEVLAVIPMEYQKWFLLAAFIINIWLRPRPAVMRKDLEPTDGSA